MIYNILIEEENIVGGFVVGFFPFLMIFCTCYYSPADLLSSN